MLLIEEKELKKITQELEKQEIAQQKLVAQELERQEKAQQKLVAATEKKKRSQKTSTRGKKRKASMEQLAELLVDEGCYVLLLYFKL